MNSSSAPSPDRRTITSGGIELTRSDAGIELGTAGAPGSIGSFDDPAAAWKALDQFDLAEVAATAEADAASRHPRPAPRSRGLIGRLASLLA